MLSITLIIIIITCIVSVTSFRNEKTTNDLIFYPPAVTHHNQWYRFWSCALIHADIGHLAFNMLSLWMFGEFVERFFASMFEGYGKLLYVALYLSTQFFCLLPTYVKNKNNYNYRSLGASGAVSAVVFVAIFLRPLQPLALLFLPIPLPGFIFGILYLFISAYMDKRGGGNINHSAHIWGAIAGIIYLLVVCYTLSTFDPIRFFISQVQTYLN